MPGVMVDQHANTTELTLFGKPYKDLNHQQVAAMHFTTRLSNTLSKYVKILELHEKSILGHLNLHKLLNPQWTKHVPLCGLLFYVRPCYLNFLQQKMLLFKIQQNNRVSQATLVWELGSFTWLCCLSSTTIASNDCNRYRQRRSIPHCLKLTELWQIWEKLIIIRKCSLSKLTCPQHFIFFKF